MKMIFILVAFVLTSCATKPNGQMDFVASEPEHDVIMLDHKYFKIAYDKKKRLARYVVYELSADQLRKKGADRKNKFKIDPLLEKMGLPLVKPSEYVNSKYDRGHLAPSADFAWSQEANDLTFVMSNMAPQKANLNQDAWRRLEDKVRRWACGEKKITVITGSILTENLPKLKSGLEIPQEFFKIIIDETPPRKVISFIYNQKDKGDVLADRVVPIKNLEKTSSLALGKEFPKLKTDFSRAPASLDSWKEEKCF